MIIIFSFKVSVDFKELFTYTETLDVCVQCFENKYATFINLSLSQSPAAICSLDNKIM